MASTDNQGVLSSDYMLHIGLRCDNNTLVKLKLLNKFYNQLYSSDYFYCLKFKHGYQNVPEETYNVNWLEAYLNYGYLYAMGYNRSGRLGLDKNLLICVPTKVTDFPIKSVCADRNRSLILDLAGKVFSTTIYSEEDPNISFIIKEDTRHWKHFNNCNLGIKAREITTMDSKIATMNNKIVVLDNDDKIRAGPNFEEILFSHGQTDNQKVGSIQHIIAGNSSLFVNNNNTLWVHGTNEYGQLGKGTNYPCQNLEFVPDIPNIKQIAAGYGYTILLDDEGFVWAAGKNDYG